MMNFSMKYSPHPQPAFHLSCAVIAPSNVKNAIHWVGVDSHQSVISAVDNDHRIAVDRILSQRKLDKGEVLWVAPDVVVQGIGRPESDHDWRVVGAKARAVGRQDGPVLIHVETLNARHALAVAYGAHVSAWSFRRFRTTVKPAKTQCQEVVVLSGHALDEDFQAARIRDRMIIDSIHWARDMANRPGNDITPATFAAAIKDIPGVQAHCVPHEELAQWGALNGVAQGSQFPACVTIAQWNGTGRCDVDPVVLVGKGVTFDSGGLSIKPSSGMEEMKLDKTGAVVVNAVLKALAEMKAPVHVVAVTPLVENMVSATAQRPGDIVTSLSGQTIEVLNTDAEGRLILADALTYAQTMWKPKSLVDVATLTGAVRVALGPVYAGVFSRHLGLRSQLEAAGQSTGECLWPLPLHADYDKALDSACADMKNITASGFGAGSSTAAQFLARFVSKDVEWAHLDIAGVDVAHAASPLCPQGGSAFGVELLIRWVLSHHSHPAS